MDSESIQHAQPLLPTGTVKSDPPASSLSVLQPSPDQATPSPNQNLPPNSPVIRDLGGPSNISIDELELEPLPSDDSSRQLSGGFGNSSTRMVDKQESDILSMSARPETFRQDQSGITSRTYQWKAPAIALKKGTHAALGVNEAGLTAIAAWAEGGDQIPIDALSTLPFLKLIRGGVKGYLAYSVGKEAYKLTKRGQILHEVDQVQEKQAKVKKSFMAEELQVAEDLKDHPDQAEKLQTELDLKRQAAESELAELFEGLETSQAEAYLKLSSDLELSKVRTDALRNLNGILNASGSDQDPAATLLRARDSLRTNAQLLGKVAGYSTIQKELTELAESIDQGKVTLADLRSQIGTEFEKSREETEKLSKQFAEHDVTHTLCESLNRSASASKAWFSASLNALFALADLAAAVKDGLVIFNVSGAGQGLSSARDFATTFGSISLAGGIIGVVTGTLGVGLNCFALYQDFCLANSVSRAKGKTEQALENTIKQTTDARENLDEIRKSRSEVDSSLIQSCMRRAVHKNEKLLQVVNVKKGMHVGGIVASGTSAVGGGLGIGVAIGTVGATAALGVTLGGVGVVLVVGGAGVWYGRSQWKRHQASQSQKLEDRQLAQQLEKELGKLGKTIETEPDSETAQALARLDATGNVTGNDLAELAVKYPGLEGLSKLCQTYEEDLLETKVEEEMVKWETRTRQAQLTAHTERIVAEETEKFCKEKKLELTEANIASVQRSVTFQERVKTRLEADQAKIGKAIDQYLRTARAEDGTLLMDRAEAEARKLLASRKGSLIQAGSMRGLTQRLTTLAEARICLHDTRAAMGTLLVRSRQESDAFNRLKQNLSKPPFSGTELAKVNDLPELLSRDLSDPSFDTAEQLQTVRELATAVQLNHRYALLTRRISEVESDLAEPNLSMLRTLHPDDFDAKVAEKRELIQELGRQAEATDADLIRAIAPVAPDMERQLEVIESLSDVSELEALSILDELDGLGAPPYHASGSSFELLIASDSKASLDSMTRIMRELIEVSPDAATFEELVSKSEQSHDPESSESKKGDRTVPSIASFQEAISYLRRILKAT